MKLALKGHGGVEETAALAGTQKASTQCAGPGPHIHVQVADGMQRMAQQVQGTAHPIGQAVYISVRHGRAACIILEEFLVSLKVWSKSGLQLKNFSNNWGQSASRRAVGLRRLRSTLMRCRAAAAAAASRAIWAIWSCIGAVVASRGRGRRSGRCRRLHCGCSSGSGCLAGWQTFIKASG